MTTDKLPEQEPITARCNLDIVQDCADLQGAFPQNVELKFVFWSHGEDLGGGQIAGRDPLEAVAPYLQDVDVVGLECPSYLGAKGECSETEAFSDFTKVNGVLRGEYKNMSLEEIFGKTIASSHVFEVFSIAQEISAISQSKLPTFGPLDDMSGSIIRPQLDQDNPEQYHSEMRSAFRRREELVIRQLHEAATSLGRDGQQHKIAILYGSRHSLLSVAARILGAPTTRVFVSRSFQANGEKRLLQHTARFGQDPSEIDRQLQAIYVSNEKGIAVTQSLGKLGLVSDDTEGYEFRNVTNQIQELILTSRQGRLTPRQTTELEHSLKALELSFDENRKMPALFKKRAEANVQSNANKAGQRILEISEELARLTTRHFVKHSPLSRSERQIIKELLFDGSA